MDFHKRIKKVFEDESLLHRFVYSQESLREDTVAKIDQKNYNNFQIGVLRSIADKKFGGDIKEFITSPQSKKVMECYREFVKAELPFLLTNAENPSFNFKDPELIDKAANFIITKLF